MSATVTLEEALATLTELTGTLTLGEEIVITQNQQPVAKLLGQRKRIQRVSLWSIQQDACY